MKPTVSFPLFPSLTNPTSCGCAKYKDQDFKMAAMRQFPVMDETIHLGFGVCLCSSVMEDMAIQCVYK